MRELRTFKSSFSYTIFFVIFDPSLAMTPSLVCKNDRKSEKITHQIFEKRNERKTHIHIYIQKNLYPH